MPDFSMCSGSERCSARRECERAPESGTKPSPWQSWQEFQPTLGFDCPWFRTGRDWGAWIVYGMSRAGRARQ